MSKIIFVIGATATGKTYFINKHFSNGDYEKLNVYDYQTRVYDEAGIKNNVSFFIQHRLLLRANNLILNDILEKLSKEQNVIVEHTLFLAKRRIAYIDEIKKIPDVRIEIYVMKPSEKQWDSNIIKRGLEPEFHAIKKDAEIIEFPNPAEGFDMIYEVIDGEVNLRMETPKPEIIKSAREEIKKETEIFLQKEKEAETRKMFLESMNYRKFWHYCEVCKKKEFLTADEAFNQGWDYPPKIGEFGLLGPRTCKDCKTTDTLYWKIMSSGLPLIIEKNLSPEEVITLQRIKNEPNSLLDEG